MMKLTALSAVLLLAACDAYGESQAQQPGAEQVKAESVDPLAQATFGSGCFWCTEAVFERLDGVVGVVSGYSGGHKKNPKYRQVTSGRSGHAEVSQIEYDPAIISYDDLLDMFWKSHDPTSLNRQGADVGTQYRSVIFFHDDEQRKLAEASKGKLAASGYFRSPIVTAIEPLDVFYRAEEYHQDYFRKNPDQAYCVYVIKPKLRKLDL